MIRNYFLVAWRNLLKNKTFTAINIFGLAFSMSVCMVIILLIQYHHQFDTFHTKRDHIYRIIAFEKNTSGLFESGYATTPKPFGSRLKEQFTHVENFTNIRKHGGAELISDKKVLNADAIFADENFFSIFDFELKSGDPATALRRPHSLVISEEQEQLLFPGEDALGKTLEYSDHGTYQVTGVIRKPAGQTHIRYQTIASYTTLEALVQKEVITEGYDSWENNWDHYNYLLLSNTADVSEVEATINQLALENIELEEGNPGYRFELQHMSDVASGNDYILSNEMHFSIPGIGLLFFTLLASIVIITASINYTNLSVARSLTRAREVGVRKVNGAGKGQIILQFLTESLMISLISVLVAIPIYEYLVRSFNEIYIFNQLGIHLQDNATVYLFFFLFTIAIGLLTGIGPSLFMSRIQLLGALKGKLSGRVPKRGFLRFSGKKLMLSVQFGLSIILLVSLFLLKSQGEFLVESDYGFEEEQVYFVEMQGHLSDELQQRLSSVAGVGNISFTSHHPAVGFSYAGGYRKNSTDEDFLTIYNFSVDPAYTEVMGIELIAGSQFPEEATDLEEEKYIILNESAVSVLGFENPADAIGQVIYDEDRKGVVVQGVVKDYHWEPLMKAIRPLALRVLPDRYDYAYLKLSGNTSAVVPAIQQMWEEYDTAREFKGGFLSEEMDLFYQFFNDISSILFLVGFLAITITGLGFLGMVSFELQSRKKEIGVRKVLGASLGGLIKSMSAGFLKMLIITSVVAFPLAIIINNLWISLMATHAPISFGNIFPAFLIILLIGGITIVTQVRKNADKNPVESLRNE